MKKMASISEVARRAEVSVATASRVLSNADYPVSASTRERVLAAAGELRYSPNSLARSLKTRRSNLIAVLVGDSIDPHFATITRGVEEAANAAGYLTIVCNTDRKPERELVYLEMLRDFRADGIIFAGGGLNQPGHPEQLEERVQAMRESGIEVVTLAQHTLQVPSVLPDNFGGARLMTRRLLELGHTRIAFITGPSSLIVANVRLQGYLAALAEAGIQMDPALIIPGSFSRASGEAAARTLAYLPAERRPTAIFASSDETAFGVLSGLQRLGLVVPDQISVGGFGDLPIAPMTTPPLTTINLPLRELGRQGAQKLLSLLRGDDIDPLEYLETTLVERASIGPAPQS